MSMLSELLKEVLSLSDPEKQKSKKKKVDQKSKKKLSQWATLLGHAALAEAKEPEVEVVEEEKVFIPVILPISAQRTRKLLNFVDSVLQPPSSSSSSTIQPNDNSYDVLQELWHYLSRELQAPHKSSKNNRAMKLTEASAPSTAISPAVAHKLRCMNLMDTLVHKYIAFRDLVQVNMMLISKSAGLMKNQNLSNEVLAKGEYVDYVLERIALWDMLYGDDVEGFRMMKRYLVEVVKAKVPNLMEKARQHEREQRTQQRIARNILLHKGEQILKSGALKDLKADVEREIHDIEEFFQILFPTFESLLENANITTTTTPKDQTAFSNEEDIDWDAIEWVSANQEDHGDNNLEKEDDDTDGDDIDFSYPIALPYTVEFELKTSMKEVISDDNEHVIDSIREHATHLLNHSLPKLKSWREIFTKVIVVYEELIADCETGSQPHSKRQRVESSSSSSISTTKQQWQRSLYQANQAVDMVEMLQEKIRVITTDKCKELFSS